MAARAPGPRGHPLIGNLVAFRRDVLGLLLESRRRFGDVVRFTLGPMLIHLVSHPDHVRQVLVTHQHHYNKATRSTAKSRGICGESLLTASGDFWLRQRRLMQPVFGQSRLAAFDTLIVEAVDQLLDSWREPAAAGRPVDVASAMMRLTCTIIGRILFGTDVTKELVELEEAATVVLGHTYRRLERIIDPPLWLPTPGNFRFRRAMARLDAVVHGIIEQRRRSGAGGDDLLSRLFRQRDESGGEGMNERQVRNETITLLLAGHETTANALAWTWCLLSLHPAVRRRVQEEVDEVLGGQPPSATDLPRLALLTRVFQESMRLYPPIWIMERAVLAEDVIGGYRIPAGSTVALSPHVTHRHPGFWDNPEGFDPDRFLPEPMASRPTCAYFPFGAGQRLCIGANLAVLEAQLILARISQRYRLDLVPGFAVRPKPGITLRPAGGLPMTLHPRQGPGTS
jgi:cytochrome P450